VYWVALLNKHRCSLLDPAQADLLELAFSGQSISRETSRGVLFVVQIKEMKMNQLAQLFNGSTNNNPASTNALNEVFADKHQTRLMAQQDCLFKAGHNNNLVARHYGRDIFSYIEPSGRRYCR